MPNTQSRAGGLEFLSAILDSSPDAIFTKDLAGRITSWNPSAERLYGYSAEEVVGESATILAPPDLHEEASRLCNRVRLGEQMIAVRTRRRRKDGGLIPVSLTLCPIVKKDGNVAGISVIAHSMGGAAPPEFGSAEETLLAAFNATPDLIVITRLRDGMVLKVNDGYERMLGFGRDESVGRTTSQLEVWANPDQRMQYLSMAARDGQVIDFECTLRHKDGAELCVLLSAREVTIDGQPCIVSIGHDVSGRKEMEAEQTRILRELNEAQRVARIGSWNWDMTTDAIMWSPVYYEILGFDPTQPAPGYREHLSAYAPESAARLEAAVTHTLETGEPYEVELELAQPAGPTHWIVADGEAKFDEDGAIVGLRGTVQDITERKMNEEQYRAVLRSAMDGFMLHDRHGRFVDVNQAYAEMSGYRIEELLELSLPDVETVESAEQIKHHMRSIFTLENDRFETRHRRKDGSFYEAEVSVSYQPMSGQYAAFIRDITGRKRREALNRVEVEVLAAANVATTEGEFLSSAAEIIAERMELDAVGIRLRQGEEYPYVANAGFSAEHISSENCILALDASGASCRNAAGAVLMECACGLVLSGSRDPSLSPGGSMWAADTSQLADIPAEKDPRLNPRNVCVHEGFASMALVPIRDGDEITGLIHLASRRTSAFSGESVKLLESIAAHVGQTVARRRAQASLARALKSIVTVLSLTTESRDPYTAGHQKRVARLASLIAQEMGLSEHEIEEIRTAALVHDIGKVTVPAEILSKPSTLSEVEFALIKHHVQASYDILKSANLEGNVAELVYQHHERIDGSGYPRGLADGDIALAARILMVADVLEAMSSHRPYRPALGIDTALDELVGHPEKYDRGVVEACIRLRNAGVDFSAEE
jgi:PAS domain S-box-containing protein/putative nucleotidyltransferase with HDIG domain